MTTRNPPRAPDRSDVEKFTKWATSPAAWFAHAQQLVDTQEMRSPLTQPSSLVLLEPIWSTAEEFISILGEREGVGGDTGRRWAEGLATIYPSRDVALFLYSTPDADGRWFSRYIFLKSDEPESANVG